MEHFYKDLGEEWFTYPELYKSMVEKFPTKSHFVEVGVWKGMSASFMAVEIINSGKQIKFDCVDTWEQIDSAIEEALYEGIWETFQTNIEPVKHIINPVRSISWEAASKYKNKSLDFVFIDASHDYESVKKDIEAWLPKVKEGGVIAGHDYDWCDGVRKAVDEVFEKKNITETELCWVYNN
jgi:predicted O-methyltransferase YrrM